MEPIRPIRTEEDHRAALREIERLWNAEAGTPEHDRFEVRGALVDVYEREHHAVEPPSVLGALRFRLEQAGVSPDAIATLLGPR